MTSQEGLCPEILPIFPLTGALLLPGGRLPLHIFEPRYRNMVEDAIEEDGFIGMIQPRAPAEQLDERPTPELYSVGCAGLIERWERLPDGRYVILLKGIARFKIRETAPDPLAKSASGSRLPSSASPRIVALPNAFLRGEIELHRQYRRVEADYAGFGIDLKDARAEVAPDRLMEALRAFGEAHRVPIDLDKLDQLSGLALLNSIAMALPFQPAEKHALLEAPDVEQRLETLLALLDMGLDLQPDSAPPTLN